MEYCTDIKITVPFDIFNEPHLNACLNNMLKFKEPDIQKRFYEIKEFIEKDNLSDPTNELSYDNIYFLFKLFLYKKLINDSIEIAFNEKGRYNVLDNIISLISEDTITEAIMGKTMIDAFSKAIRSIPNTSMIDPCIHGGMIISIENKFLDINPYN